jgi:hypothetical protein
MSAVHPTDLIPYNIIGTDSQRDSLLRIATWVADHGISGPGAFQTARDLLLRQPPRIQLNEADPLLGEDGRMTDAAKRFVVSLCTQAAVLPLQGPPGSGIRAGCYRLSSDIRPGLVKMLTLMVISLYGPASSR